MNIEVWSSFSKRKNSTLTPPAAGTQVTAVLKDATSIERPSFILNTPIANYTYVGAFGHYYFVDDVINLNASMCELVCSMDVLASYKSDIVSYTAFVERAASSYDQFINDPLLSQRQLLLNEDKTVTSLSSFFTTNHGCFIVECLAKDQGIILYATDTLDPYKYILSPDGYSTNDVTDWIQSRISQAFDLDVYIGSVKWFPFDANSIDPNATALTTSFPVGPVDIAAALNIAQPGTWNYSIYPITNKLPKHASYQLVLPTTGNFGDFRDCNNSFTQYNLYLPGVGLINLDAAIVGYAINNSKTLVLELDVDLISGEITYLLSFQASGGGFDAYIGRYSGNISVDVPIGKSAVDTVKSAKMIAGSIGEGAMHGGWIGAAIGAVAGAVEAIQNSMRPETSMIGGSGNKSEIYYHSTDIVLSRKQFGCKDYPTAVAGRPLMQNVTLSSLSGFVKCGNASVPVNAHAAERDAINNFLNSGFYIE